MRLSRFACFLVAFPLLGRHLLPEPQKTAFTGREFELTAQWRLVPDAAVPSSAPALDSLRTLLQERFGLRLSNSGSQAIRLSVAAGSVTPGHASDRDAAAIAAQAYRLSLKPNAIAIAANTLQGLFYGVETLVQLVEPRDGRYWVPEGEITDWPDLEMRILYWDDAHHLDRMEEFKRAIRQAAFFKINGFAVKLEGHFRFHSAPAIVEPQALTPAQLQELTDYGLRHYVQWIPYVDGPAHDAFILKHPEYAGLREFPQSNYEFCISNPEMYKLLFGIYDDLLAANRGSKFFFLSTDEPYYLGMGDNAQCHEAAYSQQVGGRARLLSEFVTKAGNYLHDRGRTVVFWGTRTDVASLPPHLVNGLARGGAIERQYRERGIREMIYTSAQGEEPWFPDYYLLPPEQKLHPQRGEETARVPGVFESISRMPRDGPDLMGATVAAWGDAGLHQETFWLGYAAGLAAAWRQGEPDPRQSMSAFYRLYYGPHAFNIGRVYQLMSRQAQNWEDSWDWAPSSHRKPIFGNSEGVFTPPHPARDQTLPLPGLPAMPSLAVEGNWSDINARRVQLASEFVAENDELLDLLYANLDRADYNRYNLEVFLSIARMYRHNLNFILGLNRAANLLRGAGAARSPAASVMALDQALSIAENLRAERNRVLEEATATWYKSWHPRVAEGNGVRFLHELDDVKDHRPDRTVDMSYLVYRELILPFGDWVDKLRAVRNQYARTHQLAPRERQFRWEDTQPADAGF